MKYISFLISIFFLQVSHAALEFQSERMKTMDVEFLQQIVSRNLKKLDANEDAAGPVIKQCLEVVLAHPDQSLAGSNIFEQLRTSSGSEKVFTGALSSIIDDAIVSLSQKEKNTKLQTEQSSYVYILNHMLAELQKYKDAGDYKSLIEKIRDANISFSDALVSHRLINSMTKTENPSDYAGSLINKKQAWWKFW